MIAVGLDLSLVSTGVGFVYNSQAETTRFRTKSPTTPRHPRTGKPTPPTLTQRHRRLDDLVAQLTLTVSNVGADLVVVEGPSFGQGRQAGEHDRTGLWWLVISQLLHWDHPVAEVPPATVKKYATGKGNTSKDEVLAAVIRRYPNVEVRGNDEADALVLAAMGARRLGEPIDELPKVNLTAMDAVVWPEPAAVPA
ncbi:hypothetical protein [Phytoactinopolyspora limicola]|uniref:hypothetical protein n=1 Tax=Phytoactinopolyspora limicola TaxID=2715536 RepID=UPI00140BF183|nr:hypothetical protein [Phytoactinopolyspora limicola]